MRPSPLLARSSLLFGSFVLVAACGSEDPIAQEAPKAPAVAASSQPEVDASKPVEQKPFDAGVVIDAAPKTCFDELDAKGIQYERTTARGVVDAVHVKSAIGGVKFVVEDSDALPSDPMACAFVLTLERFAQLLKTKGVVKVGTLGSYCYRCCCAWSPTNDCRSETDPEPDCGTNGYSNHSWGRAIDVRYLYTQAGKIYDINDEAEWIEGSSSTTCTSGLAAQVGISKTLYGIVCDTAAQQIFKNILTPNYNSAHRNHWHMDIGDSGTFAGTKVRAWEPTAIDVGDHADACGGH